MPRFLRELFINTPEELAPVRALLGAESRSFAGAKIGGETTRPAYIELYASAKPAYDEKPFAVYSRNDADELIDPEWTPVESAPRAPIIRRRTKPGAV